MDKELLEILVCPVCKAKLEYIKDEQVLVCKFDKLEYPIRNGFVIMKKDKVNEKKW